MQSGYGIGSVLCGVYRLERELGRGPLGTLYAGSILPGSRECAIRVLPPAAAEMVAERERFLRDHKVVAQLADLRLPAVLDTATTPEGHFLIVSELARGETLRQRLRRGALPSRAAFALIERLCQVIDAVHQRGVPHGDLRPEHIVLGRNDGFTVLELGLHHFRTGPLRAFPKPAPGVGWYTPPEVLESPARQADARGDVFALGAMLYEALTGRPAFPEAPVADGPKPRRSGLVRAVSGKGGARGRPEPELVGTLERILQTACTPRPEDRLPDAGALRGALAGLGGEAGRAAPAAPAQAPEPRRSSESMSSRRKRRPLRAAEGAASKGAEGPVSGGEGDEPVVGGDGDGDGVRAGKGPDQAPATAGPSVEAAPPPAAAPEAPVAAVESAPAPARRAAPAPAAPQPAESAPAPAAPLPAESAPAPAAPAPAPLPVEQAPAPAAIPATAATPAREPSSATPATAKDDKPLSPVAARLAALARGESIQRPAQQRPAPRTPPRERNQDRGAHGASAGGAKAQPPGEARPAKPVEGGGAPAQPPLMEATEPAPILPAAEPAPVPVPVPAAASAPAPAPPASAPAPAPAPLPAPEVPVVLLPPTASGRTPRPSLSAAPPPAEEAAPAVPSTQTLGQAERAQAEAQAAPPAAEAAALPSLASPVPGGETSERAIEAAKAIAAARAAASARLLDAARKRARVATPAAGTPAPSAVPEPIPPTPSQNNSARRRAPADLVEQPPAAGEVVTAPKKTPPALPVPQIIIDLGDEEAAQFAAEVARGHQPPPLPPGVARPSGSHPVLPLPSVAAQSWPEQEVIKQTEEVELVPRPDSTGLRTLRAVALASVVLVGLTWLVAHLLPPSASVTPRPAPTAPLPVVDDLPRLQGEIDRALAEQDWRTAVLRADQLLRTYPGDEGAQAKRRRAEAELENQFRFDGFRSAAQRGNIEAAMALYAEIPDTSVYKDRARQQAEGLRANYVAAKLAEARTARRAGLCIEVQRLAQIILALDRTQDEAASLAQRCGERAAAESPPPRHRASREHVHEGHARRERVQERDRPQEAEPPGPTLKELRDPFANH